MYTKYNIICFVTQHMGSSFRYDKMVLEIVYTIEKKLKIPITNAIGLFIFF